MGSVCFKDASTDGREGSSERNRSASRPQRSSLATALNGRDFQSSNVLGSGDVPPTDPDEEAAWILSMARCPLPPHLDRMSVGTIRESLRIDLHVKHTLKGVNNLHEIPTREPPLCMLRLHDVAEVENGWIAVVMALVDTVPIEEAVGSAVIMIVIDDCSLPTKVTINRLVKQLNLGSKHLSKLNGPQGAKWRNVCTVLGCLADKLAGPNAEAILSRDVLDFLLSCLEPKVAFETTLHALVAIEKIAKTAKNKAQFEKLQVSNLLARLEGLYYHSKDDFMAQQVGFCAQWLLDNIFLKEGRAFTYEVVLSSLETRISGANFPPNGAMLNDSDVSEYLKISADGLTARCDAYSFESVRSTLHVDSGSWFYEVQVVTPGIMQIGWATKNSRFSNHDGFGVGDDELSCAYDGCRQFIWHNALTTRHSHRPWKMGDYVGFLIDLDHEEIVFSLNGEELDPEKEIFIFAKSGFYAAASFMSFQQCVFNFGDRPFAYPPDKGRRPNVKRLIEACFLFDNQFDEESGEDMPMCILPRHIKQKRMLERLERSGTSFSESSPSQGGERRVRRPRCFICCTYRADTIILPCKHTGVCMNCALQIEQCAVCRAMIDSRQLEQEYNNQNNITTNTDNHNNHSAQSNSAQGVLTTCSTATATTTQQIFVNTQEQQSPITVVESN